MRGGKINNQNKGIFNEPSYAEKRSIAPKPDNSHNVNNLVNDNKEGNSPNETHPSLYKYQLNASGFDRKPKSVSGIGCNRA